MTRLSELLGDLAGTGGRLRATWPSGLMLAVAAALIGLVVLAAAGLGGASHAGLATDQAAGSGGFAASSAGNGDLGSGLGLGTIADVAGKAILVIVLLVFTLRLMHRFSTAANPASARLVVLESRPLAQRATVYLIAIGERRLVVGLTPTGLVSLAELAADELPEADDADAPVEPARGGQLAGGTFERLVRAAADLARRGGTVR